ncbi:MAG: hypothetical protein J0H81_03835 [Sphingopyxis terrae]|nr:hypothetical protein [Sphingopyxis terrae]
MTSHSPDRLLLMLVRLGRCIEIAIIVAILALMTGLSFLLDHMGWVRFVIALVGLTALLAALMLVIIVTEATSRMRLRMLCLRPALNRIERMASAIPDTSRTHCWVDDGPGAIALSGDRAWLCCSATGFVPMEMVPGQLLSLFAYSFARPARIGLLVRPEAGHSTVAIAIPFAGGPEEMNLWRNRLQPFTQPEGASRR